MNSSGGRSFHEGNNNILTYIILPTNAVEFEVINRNTALKL